MHRQKARQKCDVGLVGGMRRRHCDDIVACVRAQSMQAVLDARDFGTLLDSLSALLLLRDTLLAADLAPPPQTPPREAPAATVSSNSAASSFHTTKPPPGDGDAYQLKCACSMHCSPVSR